MSMEVVEYLTFRPIPPGINGNLLLRDELEPERYVYLDYEESKLYDSVKHSDDHKDKTIKTMLEERALDCCFDHCAETR